MLFFRHHMYEKRGGKEVVLNEVGPRFEMQLYQLRLGTLDQVRTRGSFATELVQAILSSTFCRSLYACESHPIAKCFQREHSVISSMVRWDGACVHSMV